MIKLKRYIEIWHPFSLIKENKTRFKKKTYYNNKESIELKNLKPKGQKMTQSKCTNNSKL